MAPVVTKTSTLTPGLSAVKCILTGYNLSIANEQLHTEHGDASPEQIAALAEHVGLTVNFGSLPLDYLQHIDNKELPVIIPTQSYSPTPNFVVVWNKIGPLVQVMDPGKGRQWLFLQDFLANINSDSPTISTDAWQQVSQNKLFCIYLRKWLAKFRIPPPDIDDLMSTAATEPNGSGMAALDAATRMVAALLQDKGFQRGAETAAMLRHFYNQALQEPTTHIPTKHWFAEPEPAQDQLKLHQNVSVVQITGYAPEKVEQLTASKNDSPAEPAEPVTSQTSTPTSSETPDTPDTPEKSDTSSPNPMVTLFKLMWANDVVTPSIIATALIFSGVGLTLQALLYRSFIKISSELPYADQRLAAVGFLVLFALTLLVLALFTQSSIFTASRVLETRLRIAVLSVIPNLSYQRLQNYSTGDLTERIHTIQNMRMVPIIGTIIVQLFAQCVLTILGLLWLSWVSALIAVLKIAVFVAVNLNMGQFLRTQYRKLYPYIGALSRLYLDGLLGLIPLRTHGVERSVRREYEGLLTQWAKSKTAVETSMFWGRSIDKFLTESLTALLIFVYVIQGNEITDLPLLIYWIINLDFMIEALTGTIFWFIGETSRSERIFEISQSPHEQDEYPSQQIEAAAQQHQTVQPAPGFKTKTKGVAITTANLNIEIDNRPILTDVNLTIAPGSHIAVVGPSGAGKSTLVGTLLGWYYPSNGYILVDDLPLTHNRLQTLRRNTAWVDPSVQLWNRSLLFNLNYGPGEASINQVIQQADLFSVLDRLPQGLQTRLGESGQLVSGGEGQRIRFGRVLQHQDARLVILDEPFRGLDREKRGILLKRARELWADTTLVCVTHDVGETQSFERVLVVENGQIIEDGPPAQLIARPNSRYKAMLNAEENVRTKLWASRDVPWRRLWLSQGQLQETDSEQT